MNLPLDPERFIADLQRLRLVRPVNTGGGNLSLTLNIAFPPGFPGNRIFYLAARDAAEPVNIGWQSKVAWAVQ